MPALARLVSAAHEIMQNRPSIAWPSLGRALARKGKVLCGRERVNEEVMAGWGMGRWGLAVPTGENAEEGFDVGVGGRVVEALACAVGDITSVGDSVAIAVRALDGRGLDFADVR